MGIISNIGALLFIVLYVLSTLLNIFQPQRYWEDFIPRLYKKEKKHPVITMIILLSLVIIILYGALDTILR